MDITAGAVTAPAQAEEDIEYASWLRRFGALLIDGIILSVVTFVLFFIIGIVLGVGAARSGRAPAPQSLQGLFLIGYFVLPALYFVAGNGIGATPGKSMLGIRVRLADSDESIGLVRSLIRYVVPLGLAILLLIPYVADYLWPLFDARNQSLHDKVAGSVVVRD